MISRDLRSQWSFLEWSQGQSWTGGWASGWGHVGQTHDRHHIYHDNEHIHSGGLIRRPATFCMHPSIHGLRSLMSKDRPWFEVTTGYLKKALRKADLASSMGAAHSGPQRLDLTRTCLSSNVTQAAV